MLSRFNTDYELNVSRTDG